MSEPVSDHDGPRVDLNLNVRGLSLSATVGNNEQCDALIAGGRRIHKLVLGQSPFPVPDCLVRQLRENAHQKDYLPVRGLPRLREAVARHHRRKFGIDCDPDQVLVGPGSKELMFILQLVYYGDLVIPTPAWVSYGPQARIIGRQIYRLPTRREDGWRLTPACLDEFCSHDSGRPRLVVLNYPSNPTGGSYTASELEQLAGVARRHRLLLLSDEIYGRLHHHDSHVSIVPYYPEGTIFSSGLSKWCGAGGWRLGLFVVPRALRWLMDTMAAVASETFTSTSAPIQHAAIPAFTSDPEINRYTHDCQRILRALGHHLTQILQAAKTSLTPPVGGFYLFPDFTPWAEPLKRRGIETSAALCRQLLEQTGVAALPGSDFGCPEQQLTVRLAYVNFDGAAALHAVRDLPAADTPDPVFLEHHCRETLQAVRLVCDWLENG